MAPFCMEAAGCRLRWPEHLKTKKKLQNRGFIPDQWLRCIESSYQVRSAGKKEEAELSKLDNCKGNISYLFILIYIFIFYIFMFI